MLEQDTTAHVQYLLRPARSDDAAFLISLYASTRAEEMSLVDWGDAQKSAFLQMQFDAQTKHYLLHYPSAQYHIVNSTAGEMMGRLILNYSEDSLLIIDIALLPAFQKKGIGTQMLQDLIGQAQERSLPLVLRVEFFNPAIRLYSRLGFVKSREVNDVYHEMILTPRRGG